MSGQESSGGNEEWTAQEDQLLLVLVEACKASDRPEDKRIWLQVADYMNVKRGTNIRDRTYTKDTVYSRYSSHIMPNIAYADRDRRLVKKFKNLAAENARYADQDSQAIATQICVSHTSWTANKIELLRLLLHFNKPGGLNRTENLSWRQLAERMDQLALLCNISGRIYTETNVRIQYNRYIKLWFQMKNESKELVDLDDHVDIDSRGIFRYYQVSGPNTNWSAKETQHLRELTHVSKPGGLNLATNRTAHERLRQRESLGCQNVYLENRPLPLQQQNNPLVPA
jgi:hypothetical protein